MPMAVEDDDANPKFNDFRHFYFVVLPHDCLGGNRNAHS
jgi:hypothetical protein